MELHTLQRENPNKKARQVGRGGTRGKTAGRGGKGQTARAGNKRRPELRDIIKKIPKLKGYRTRSFEIKNTPVNLGVLETFEEGSVVTKELLFEKKIIRRVGGVLPSVKILAKGVLTKKITIVDCLVSEKAKEQISKVGGEIK